MHSFSFARSDPYVFSSVHKEYGDTNSLHICARRNRLQKFVVAFEEAILSFTKICGDRMPSDLKMLLGHRNRILNSPRPWHGVIGECGQSEKTAVTSSEKDEFPARILLFYLPAKYDIRREHNCREDIDVPAARSACPGLWNHATFGARIEQPSERRWFTIVLKSGRNSDSGPPCRKTMSARSPPS